MVRKHSGTPRKTLLKKKEEEQQRLQKEEELEEEEEEEEEEDEEEEEGEDEVEKVSENEGDEWEEGDEEEESEEGEEGDSDEEEKVNDVNAAADDDDDEEDEGDEDQDEGNEEEEEKPQPTAKAKLNKVVVKPMSDKKLKKFKAAHERTGVVYLSNLPPFLKPPKLRHLLSQYGKIGRLYLKPEDNSLRRRRKKNGGNKGKRFTEGWVEFAEKKIAKRVARGLNNTTMGGKKSSKYYDDMWSIKYLKKFKWVHLQERMALSKVTKESRVRAELGQAKKQNDFYRAKVGQAKAIRSMEERRKRKAKGEAGGGGEARPSKQRIIRHFKQREKPTRN